MGQIGKYLRLIQGGEHIHYCPGCDEAHILPWRRGGWTFDGNIDAPTFTPSFLHRGVTKEAKPYVCHYILTNGILNFCPDSTHALSGQSVPLPPLPDWLSDRWE